MALETVIGLEVHVQLATRSKLFSTASASYGAESNANITPYCVGLPGTLPTLNGEAVRLALRAGCALGCELQRTSVFARKHYFYPDLPKGYQISQYERPLFLGGRLAFESGTGTSTCRIHRIHLEEDAGKTTHMREFSLVDLNRAGVPLLEIVTEPDLRSPAQAVAFLRELRRSLVFLGVTDGNMEEGSFRCDANISMRPIGGELGTRTEIKNLNSFRFVEAALEFEAERQEDLLDSGQEVLQETRLFNEATGETKAMRGKEEAEDYRYFPDPDLPALRIDDEQWAEAKAASTDLPFARSKIYQATHGLSRATADVLLRDLPTASVFEDCIEEGASPQRTASFIENVAIPELGEDRWLQLASERRQGTVRVLAALAAWLDEGKYSLSQLRPMVERLLEGTLSVAAAQSNLDRATPTVDLTSIVEELLDHDTALVDEYLDGNTKVIGFFMGKIMKLHPGIDPRAARAELQETLDRRRKE